MLPHLPLRAADHTHSYPSGYEKLSVHAAKMNADFSAPCHLLLTITWAISLNGTALTDKIRIAKALP